MRIVICNHWVQECISKETLPHILITELRLCTTTCHHMITLHKNQSEVKSSMVALSVKVCTCWVVCHGVHLLGCVSWCALVGLCVIMWHLLSWCVLVGLCVMVCTCWVVCVYHGVVMCHDVYCLGLYTRKNYKSSLRH